MTRAVSGRLLGTMVALLVVFALAACAGRPPALDGATGARFIGDGRTRAATPQELEELILGYREARRFSDDVGTTHSLRVEVALADGRSIVVLGGNPGRLDFQTVLSSGKQYNIMGQRLHDLLSRVATELASPE